MNAYEPLRKKDPAIILPAHAGHVSLLTSRWSPDLEGSARQALPMKSAPPATNYHMALKVWGGGGGGGDTHQVQGSF